MRRLVARTIQQDLPRLKALLEGPQSDAR
jgi:hypothetical protein